MVKRLCDSRPHQVFEQSEIEYKKSKYILFFSLTIIVSDNLGGCTQMWQLESRR